MDKELQLRAISLNENEEDPIFNSENCQELLRTYRSYYPKIGYDPPWIGYLILNTNLVVGSCGFVNQPIDGKVEIAYWTFKENEGKGIASFGCASLISIAKSHDNNIIITAKTAPMIGPSTSILKKNGFVQTRIVQDHEIGDAWEWVLEDVK